MKNNWLKHNLDAWNTSTGVFAEQSSSYYEMLGMLEEAYERGRCEALEECVEEIEGLTSTVGGPFDDTYNTAIAESVQLLKSKLTPKE